MRKRVNILMSNEKDNFLREIGPLMIGFAFFYSSMCTNLNHDANL